MVCSFGGAAKISLLSKIVCFGVVLDALNIKQHRIPVNQRDDLQGQQRVFYGVPTQFSVCKRLSSTAKRTGKDSFLTIIFVDLDLQLLSRKAKLEVKLKFKARERRHIKKLGHAKQEATVR